MMRRPTGVTTRKVPLLVGVLAIVSACALPAEDAGRAGEGAAATTTLPVPTSSTSTTAATGDGPPEQLLPSVSAEACDRADPWSRVETAFAGTVVSVEDRVSRDRELMRDEMGPRPAAEEWPWVTFAVDAWFTTDYGTSFSMWAPGLEAVPGEGWLVAGSLHFEQRQTGEVFPCISMLATDEGVTAWEDRFGGSVVPGEGITEQPADPEVLALIEEQRDLWESRAPAAYTAAIYLYREPWTAADECGASGSTRAVVEDGFIVEAVDLALFCPVPSTDGVATIDDLFDLAADATGALEGPIVFDETYGFVRSFSASDRSVHVGGSVELFVPEAVPAVVGTEGALVAAAQARELWEASGIPAYIARVEVVCFCTVGGRWEVTVTDGAVTGLTRLDDSGFEPSAGEFDFTVEGLLGLLDTWGGEHPDQVVAGFHPTLGYPVDLRIDAITEAIDDEITVIVSSLTPQR